MLMDKLRCIRNSVKIGDIGHIRIGDNLPILPVGDAFYLIRVLSFIQCDCKLEHDIVKLFSCHKVDCFV